MADEVLEIPEIPTTGPHPHGRAFGTAPKPEPVNKQIGDLIQLARERVKSDHRWRRVVNSLMDAGATAAEIEKD